MPGQTQAQRKNPKPRLRAALACHRCHEKKTKCDLLGSIGAICSNCKDVGAPCLQRPSMRNRNRRKGNGSLGQSTGPVPGLHRPKATSPSAIVRHMSEQVQVEGTSPLRVGPSRGPGGMRSPANNCVDQSSAMQSTPGTQVALTSVEDVVESACRHGVDSYLGDAGYMSMFGPKYSRKNHDGVGRVEESYNVEPLAPALKSCYLETFMTYCCTFCPILDSESLRTAAFLDSRLLEQALALLGTIIQPPLLGGRDPTVHYRHARNLFNSGTEGHPIASLIAIMLFYWWSTDSPNVVSKNGTWFWTGIAVRQAQEMGLHSLRNPRSLIPGDSWGLRRRIWWTLYVSATRAQS